MRVLISGIHGKMGSVTARVATERGYYVEGVDIIYKTSEYTVYNDFKKVNGRFDFIVDFSSKSALKDVLNYALDSDTPCVLAVTGYDENDIALINEASAKIPIAFSSNYSLGINAVKDAVRTIINDGFRDSDIEIIEYHHGLKKDAPSGTALAIAETVCAETHGNISLCRKSGSLRVKNEIGIHSVRGGNISGKHEIMFCMPDEIITVTHEASSNRVFAVGAINAGEGLIDAIVRS